MKLQAVAEYKNSVDDVVQSPIYESYHITIRRGAVIVTYGRGLRRVKITSIHNGWGWVRSSFYSFWWVGSGAAVEIWPVSMIRLWSIRLALSILDLHRIGVFVLLNPFHTTDANPTRQNSFRDYSKLSRLKISKLNMFDIFSFVGSASAVWTEFATSQNWPPLVIAYKHPGSLISLYLFVAYN